MKFGPRPIKRWFVALYTSWEQTLAVLREQLLEELNWRQRTVAERKAFARNLLLYWLIAPVVLLIFVWLVNWILRT